MEATYEEVHDLHQSVLHELDTEDRTPTYYQAVNYLTDLAQLAYYKIGVRELYLRWLREGGTLVLRDELLPLVGYGGSLAEFNAFAMIDAAQGKIKVILE